eukprot:TRINITY_DN841_c0_g1_i1.p1 TRINITY_DN841_c0_g1~~TRINITY_DN841_c0_g1_i1.p1  ORF type:complete len:959 (+),score=445.34 TRINITY_DN841_c0_g1_i1:146-3022(+)
MNNPTTQMQFEGSDLPPLNLKTPTKISFIEASHSEIVSAQDSEILENLPMEEKHRQRLIYDLINYERQYAYDLGLLIEGYEKPLSAMKWFSKNDIKTLFSTPNEILSGVNSLIEDCDNRQKESIYFSRVADIYLRKQEYFKIYPVFSLNFPKARLLVQQLTDKIPQFKEFIHASATRPEMRNMAFTDLIAAPLQHIEGYSKPLQELLEYTPPDHRDYRDVKNLVTLIGSASEFVSEAYSRAFSTRKLHEIQNRLDASEDLTMTLPARVFIDEAHLPAVVVRTKKKLYEKELDLVLCNDLILLLKKNGHVVLKKFVGPISIAEVYDDKDTVLPNALEIIQDGEGFVLAFETPEERDSWLNKIVSGYSASNSQQLKTVYLAEHVKRSKFSRGKQAPHSLLSASQTITTASGQPTAQSASPGINASNSSNQIASNSALLRSTSFNHDSLSTPGKKTPKPKLISQTSAAPPGAAYQGMATGTPSLQANTVDGQARSGQSAISQRSNSSGSQGGNPEGDAEVLSSNDIDEFVSLVMKTFSKGHPRDISTIRWLGQKIFSTRETINNHRANISVASQNKSRLEQELFMLQSSECNVQSARLQNELHRTQALISAQMMFSRWFLLRLEQVHRETAIVEKDKDRVLKQVKSPAANEDKECNSRLESKHSANMVAYLEEKGKFLEAEKEKISLSCRQGIEKLQAEYDKCNAEKKEASKLLVDLKISLSHESERKKELLKKNAMLRNRYEEAKQQLKNLPHDQLLLVRESLKKQKEAELIRREEEREKRAEEKRLREELERIERIEAEKREAEERIRQEEERKKREEDERIRQEEEKIKRDQERERREAEKRERSEKIQMKHEVTKQRQAEAEDGAEIEKSGSPATEAEEGADAEALEKEKRDLRVKRLGALRADQGRPKAAHNLKTMSAATSFGGIKRSLTQPAESATEKESANVDSPLVTQSHDIN